MWIFKNYSRGMGEVCAKFLTSLREMLLDPGRARSIWEKKAEENLSALT
jgi:hypothetical protein